MVPSDSGLTRSPDFPKSTYLSRAVKVVLMGLSIVSFIGVEQESVDESRVEEKCELFCEKRRKGWQEGKEWTGKARGKVKHEI